MINKNQLAEFIAEKIGGNHKNNLKLIREFEEITEGKKDVTTMKTKNKDKFCKRCI